jgi:hypothetical protein
MTNELFLAMDNETGGLADDVSLLSTYLEVVNSDFQTIDSLSLFVKPNDGLYKVEAGGLAINKINLIEHDKIARTYSDAGQNLYRFLVKNSNQGKNKLIPLGKNIAFDVNGVTKHLLNKKHWEQFVSYRHMDITPFARALQFQGKIPPDLSLGLFALAEFLKITNISGNPHEAEYDTKLTIAVFRGLLSL